MGPLMPLVALTAMAPDRLLWHPVRLDSEGKLLSWVPGDAPYDKVVRKAWQSFLSIPVQPNGYRTYFTYPVFYGPNDQGHKLYEGRSWCHNPAGIGCMLVDSATLYYAYSGDRRPLLRAKEMLDHHLRFGMTSPTDRWASVPYTSSDAGDPVYRGATDARYEGDGIGRGRGDGRGYLEPDKVGEFGYACLTMYKQTLDPRYRLAATRCADALARNIKAGDESHSPWPFRVDARTGAKIREAYTANTVGPLRLLDEMVRLGYGDVASYRRTRKTAWNWLSTYPMRNHVWTGYFEDVLIYPDYRTNLNQYSPLETARYLLQHPELDPQWRTHAKGLIDWVAGFFAQDSKTMAGIPEKGNQWGAEVVSEQVNDMDKMSSHTARFASVLALWFEKTGDPSAKQRAFRSFNWATYSARENGLVKTSLDEGTGYWFSDGYGDYMRHFQRGMASVPEWAPSNEDHLLGSTSVVRSIRYRKDEIRYRTFDRDSTETFRLRRRPATVLGGAASATPMPNGGWVVKVRHPRTETVVVRLS